MPQSNARERGALDAPAPKKVSRPRLHYRLSARSLERLRPGRHNDGDGLMVQVTKNGSRSWVLRTVVHGARRDIGLGSLQLVTLAQARDLAKELRVIARAGGDPKATLAKRRARAMPFGLATAIVHSQHEKSWKNRKHAKQWIHSLEEYVFPALGEMSVEVIRSEHIVAALSAIWLTKCETARRVLQRIGTVLLWAKGNGHRTDSPTDEIRAARKALPRQNDAPRHHKALPYPKLPTFIDRLRSCGASESVKLAFEFLILTATRTNEVLDASWSEVDIGNSVWTIPASRMKAKREHQVPLTERCIAILKIARTLDARPAGYLFPGTTRGRPLSNMAFLMLLRRMGVDITAHGFRSTFRVWCAEQTNMPREVAEAALAHAVKDATEAAYMRSTFFEKRRQLMVQWADFALGVGATDTSIGIQPAVEQIVLARSGIRTPGVD